MIFRGRCIRVALLLSYLAQACRHPEHATIHFFNKNILRHGAEVAILQVNKQILHFKI